MGEIVVYGYDIPPILTLPLLLATKYHETHGRVTNLVVKEKFRQIQQISTVFAVHQVDAVVPLLTYLV